MERKFSLLKDTEFDLLVCGGGIYGAWTVYDASLRGLKVALVDKGDWASGTSSASSKLIHGGLRYLESYDFKLVKKTLAERQMLLKAAPHRVLPLRFGLPVYKTGRLNRISLKLGLTLYDWLAGNVPETQKHRYHNQQEFSRSFPSLSSENLLAGFTYFDAQTDDARLVLELVDGACHTGAIAVNYCEVSGFIEQDNVIKSVTVADKISGEVANITAKKVVDTTGRWSSRLHNGQQNYRLSKGIHLLLPKVLDDEALILTAKSDGRVFFIIPWYGLSLIGTTDTNYEDDIDNLPITQAEINYLLREANQALKQVNWTEQHILGKFVGVRVLQPSNNSTPDKISRDWALDIAPSGLISSIGGKLTSAREDAALIVDAVCKSLGINQTCQTFGKIFPWLADIGYQSLLDHSLAQAQALGIDQESALWLVRRHGKRSTQIFEMCLENRHLCQRILPELPLILADLIFCARNEMVITLEDLLRRRLPLALLTKMTSQELSTIANTVATELGWEAETIKQEIANYKNLIKST